MEQPRVGASATPLGDGSVAIVGGRWFVEWPEGTQDAACMTPTAEAFVWDASGRSGGSRGALRHARSMHAAVRLRDGRILVAGGDGEVACPLRASGETPLPIEVWDPATGESTAFEGSEAASGRGAFLLPDGRVLLPLAAERYGAGGIPGAYDRWPAFEGASLRAEHAAWHETGRLDVDACAFAPLPDGGVLVARIGSMQRWDPDSGAFTDVPAGSPLQDPYVVVPIEGDALAFVPETPADAFHVYRPATGEWTRVPYGRKRAAWGAVVLPLAGAGLAFLGGTAVTSIVGTGVPTLDVPGDGEWVTRLP